MNRRVLGWTGAVVAITAAASGAVWYGQQDAGAEATARAQAARAQRRERDRARDERIQRIQEESADLMPDLLEGVHLGMPLEEVRRARPRIEANPTARDPAEPHLRMYAEQFPNGARAVYAFENPSQRLQRVQVLSLLPDARAIAPHLAAMNEQYGSPTGVWDCPQTGGVPTRRFTWRHGETTVADIFLVYGGRVSVTLYIAPSEVIAQSLRRSGCHPVRDRSALERFPAADPEQLRNDPAAP